MKKIVDILVGEFNRNTVKNKNFNLIGDVLYVGDTKVYKFLKDTIEIEDEETINSIIDEWVMRVYRDGNMPRIGDIIELTADMKEDPNPILKGTKGEVLNYTTNFTFNEDYIDVKWFNGRGLKLIVGLDEFKVIDKNNNNINESEDKQELFINKVLSILGLPYFKSLDTIGIDDKNIQKLIFSKLFNDNVTIENNKIYNSNGNITIRDNTIYDSNGNRIYFENNKGFWSKQEYDSNGNRIYYENSDGEWNKREYDSNGNKIYFEDSSGEWSKSEYDSNGNEIYFEDSDGYWEKRKYDSNGNQIYYEDYDGTIHDNRSGDNINESEDKQELFVNKLLSILDKPYFRSLDTIGIDDKNTQELILSRLFNDDVTIENNKIYNSNGNLIYSEYSDGYWFKQEYDSDGNQIYYENSDGKWDKREYNSNGNEIYYENSNGNWDKAEYDSNGNRIYYETSDGYWEKRKYNSNGNRIYYETSEGYWDKYEYDSNGNLIYSEDSYGTIYDNRPNNINESIIDKFIEFAKNELALPNDFKINLTPNSDDIETLANYDIKKNIISVKTKNRAIPDIIRSIAHEMTHHKQKTNGDLRGKSIEGEDGSPWEDHANAKSGELVRRFGRINPEIYDL